MGKIKSALEIALERTEDIKIDENKIRQAQSDERIKRIAGEYLNKESEDKSILKKLEDFSDEDVKRALKPLVLSSLSLPGSEVVDDRFERILELIKIVLKSAEASQLSEQIAAFLKQYPLHKKQLIEQIEEQLKPALEQKSQEMSERLGRPIHLSIEDDKEALEIINTNLERLDSQYQESLKEAKEKLESYF